MKVHQSDNKLSLLIKTCDDKITRLSAKIRKSQQASSSSPLQSVTAEQPTEPATPQSIESDSEPEDDHLDDENWPPEGITIPPNSYVVKRVSKIKFVYKEKFSFKGTKSGFQCGSCPSIIEFATSTKHNGKLWDKVVYHIRTWHENGAPVGRMFCKRIQSSPDLFQYGKFTFEVIGKKCKCCECGFMATQNPLRKFQYIMDHILEEHVQIQKKYKCGFCRKLYLTQSGRSIHVRIHHSRHQKNVLAQSGQKTKKKRRRKKPKVSNQFQDGERTPDENAWPPKCIVIPADTPSVKRVSNNKFTYQREFQFEGTDFGFKCLSCPFLTKFATGPLAHAWNNIVGHIRDWHSDATRRAAKTKEKAVWNTIEVAPNRFLHGDVPFKKLENHQYECGDCGFVPVTNPQIPMHNIVTHIRHQHLQPPKEYICEVCGKQLQSQEGLNGHKLIQHEITEEQYVSCSVCDKKFKGEKALSKHNKRVHGGPEEKKKICEVCGKRFSTAVQLEGHKFSHTGVRTFKCLECGKMFASYTALNAHQHSHTGKKFTCDICGMDFTQHYSVTRHKKTAHAQ